jgi:hypothetical protein
MQRLYLRGAQSRPGFPRGSRSIAIAVRAAGALNTTVLRASIGALVRRHEALRTTFTEVGGVAIQVVNEDVASDVDVVELAGTPLASVEAEIRRLAHSFVKEDMDLATGPLFAARLYGVSSRDHVLVLALNHLVSDGVSLHILLKELWELYDQRMRGAPFCLPELRVQFGDYAIWQQKTYDTWLGIHETYWRGRLSGAPRIRYPGSDGRGMVAGACGALAKYEFGRALSQQLRDVARDQRTELPLIILTTYIAVISRYAKQGDVLLGFYSSGRYRFELHTMIGFLTTIVYLRVRVAEGDSFLDLLRRVSGELYSAIQHGSAGHLPELIEDTRVIDLYFNYLDWSPAHEYPRSLACGQDAAGELRIDPFPLELAWPANWSPRFYERAGEIAVVANYVPEAGSRRLIEQFVANLRGFCEAFVRDPGARIGSYQ